MMNDHSDDEKSFNSGKDGTVQTEIIANEDLIEDAGQIKLDPAESWGKGILTDVKRTVLSHWVSEMTNFNQKTVAVTLLLFISVISPTLTFGAVYGKVTDNHIGAIETILGTSWVGITSALIGGMPLCIIGSTGPVLAFTTVLYNLADSLGVPFLSFYAWCSVWLLIYVFIAAFFDLSRYVKLATRFTDDIFAFLIVSIFVMDAIGDPFSNVGILRYFDPAHPSHEDADVDYSFMATALLSTILGLGTTWLIFFFRGFKDSSFFCNSGFRTSIHDFAVSLSVLIWTLVKNFLFSDIDTETLKVPERFETSFACCDSSCTTFWPDDCLDRSNDGPAKTRDWFANMGDLGGKPYAIFVAAGPAVLAFLLVYLDNGITWHLITHPNHKLEHGEAYRYDLLLSGIFNFINGLLGLPWLVATTVPCIIHLNGLADKDKDGNFVRVQETRLTGLFAHVLMALSILALSALKLIPLPVLYGVFLFMGLASLPGIQFWNRILLFFRQPSAAPETPYTKYMKLSRVHLYTVFQILFFSGVFLVQNIKTIAIVFPFMTLLCIPGRMFLLPKFFAGWELLLLDGDNEEIREWEEAKESAMGNVSAGAEDSSDDDDLEKGY